MKTIERKQNWKENSIFIFLKTPIKTVLVPQVPVLSWFDDLEDAELLNLLPVFEELSQADNVYTRLDQLRGHWGSIEPLGSC